MSLRTNIFLYKQKIKRMVQTKIKESLAIFPEEKTFLLPNNKNKPKKVKAFRKKSSNPDTKNLDKPSFNTKDEIIEYNLDIKKEKFQLKHTSNIKTMKKAKSEKNLKIILQLNNSFNKTEIAKDNDLTEYYKQYINELQIKFDEQLERNTILEEQIYKMRKLEIENDKLKFEIRKYNKYKSLWNETKNEQIIDKNCENEPCIKSHIVLTKLYEEYNKIKIENFELKLGIE
jgi:hypothetical protein